MKVSIITPTYNRESTLERAFLSLQQQTCKDFEWIIVDDGSKDHTKELIDNWKSIQSFPIAYFYKENGGKHTAVNLGVTKAKGEYSIILDSDDSLTPDAVAVIIKDFAKYENNPSICCISYNRHIENKMYQDKMIPGGLFISDHIHFRYNQEYYADRAEVFKTEILKEYPFPVFEGERFISEAIAWNQMALKYQTVYVDYDIYQTTYLEDGLTKNSIKVRVNNPKGTIANYDLMMRKPFKLKLRLKYSTLYNTFSKFAQISFFNRLRNGNYLLLILTKPFGDFVYWKWKKYLQKEEKQP